jgi:hypothetical protein
MSFSHSSLLAATVIAASALLSFAPASHAALIFTPITVPNAGFEIIEKPGSPGVVATSFTSFSSGIGPGAVMSTCCGIPNPVIFWSDSTTGDAGAPIFNPGWTGPSNVTGVQNLGNPGVGAYTQGKEFGGSPTTLVDSSAALTVIAPDTGYIATIDATGSNNSPAGPSLFQLLANGVPLPNAAVLPNVVGGNVWTTYTLSFSAADLAAHIGESLTLRFGLGGNPGNEFGHQIQWDNATLTAVTSIPEPASLGLLGLGLAAAFRRRHA